MIRKLIYILLITLLFNAINELKAEVKEGDTVNFWSVTYVDWFKGTLPPQERITAVCKKVGVNCYFFLDTAATNPVQQTAIVEFVNRFDNDYYGRLTDLYGPCPDALDHDSRIYILAIKPTWWGGYFDPAQQMPDSMVSRLWGVHSSEHEIIYISADHVQQGRESIIAHEFGHMLGWEQDHSPEPPDKPTIYWEDTWVDEGFSTFADTYLNAHIDDSGYLLNSFFNGPEKLSLINWTGYLNYNSSLLFMLYMYEHFGKDVYLKALLRNQLNGIAGVESTVQSLGYNLSFDKIFENWTLANYLDRKIFNDSVYYYNHFDFTSRFHRYEHSNYPVIVSDSISTYSSDFIKLNSTGSLINLQLTFNGNVNSKFRIALILMNSADSSVIGVIDVPLNDSNVAKYDFIKFGKDYDKAVLVIMNTDKALKEFQSTDYSYTLTPSMVEVKDNKQILPSKIYYSKIYDAIYLDLPDKTNNKKQVLLYDVNGKIIESVNTLNDQIKLDTGSLSKGLYIAIVRNGVNIYSLPVMVY